MDDKSSILTELMLQADIFCSQIEGGVKRKRGPEIEELRLKISQCRGAVEHLQNIYEDGKLAIDYKPAAATFRQLIMSLMWVSFYGHSRIDRRLFRKLIQIESGFTYLLLTQTTDGTKRGEGKI